MIFALFEVWVTLLDLFDGFGTKCKGCNHDRYKHNRELTYENGEPLFEDVCGDHDERNYWGDNYHLCGCALFVPKWKFWDRRRLRVRDKTVSKAEE